METCLLADFGQLGQFPQLTHHLSLCQNTTKETPYTTGIQRRQLHQVALYYIYPRTMHGMHDVAWVLDQHTLLVVIHLPVISRATYLLAASTI